MKSVIKLVICAVVTVGLFFTPASPLKAYKNISTFTGLRKDIASYDDVSSKINDIKKTFESSRNDGAPALLEPSEAVKAISAIPGTTIQQTDVLQSVGSTVKNLGSYTESTSKEEVNALQFVINTDDVNKFLTELDKLEYLVENIRVSPSEKLIVLTINFSGGMNHE